MCSFLDAALTGASEIEEVQEHAVSEGPRPRYDVLLETGNLITVVDSHYFLVDSGQWVAVQNLKSSSRLRSLDGHVGIASVVRRKTPFIGKAYNLKIRDDDRYLVGQDAVIVRDY